MTKSILNDCLLLRKEPVQKIFAYFKSIGLTMFDGLLNGDKIKEVLYVLAAYSDESPLVIARQDDIQQKRRICSFLEIPEPEIEDLINLKDKEVRNAAIKFMQEFCGIEFSAWMRMKVQYNDYDIAITSRDEYLIEDKEGNKKYDVKAHGDAVKQMAYLSREIAKMEKVLTEKNKQFDGISEMKQWIIKNSSSMNNLSQRTLRPEANAYIK